MKKVTLLFLGYLCFALVGWTPSAPADDLEALLADLSIFDDDKPAQETPAAEAEPAAADTAEWEAPAPAEEAPVVAEEPAAPADVDMPAEIEAPVPAEEAPVVAAEPVAADDAAEWDFVAPAEEAPVVAEEPAAPADDDILAELEAPMPAAQAPVVAAEPAAADAAAEWDFDAPAPEAPVAPADDDILAELEAPVPAAPAPAPEDDLLADLSWEDPTPAPAPAPEDDLLADLGIEEEPAPAPAWDAEEAPAPAADQDFADAELPVAEGELDEAPADPQMAGLLAQQEEVRRQAREREGADALERAYRALERNEFEEARTAFLKAVENIPEREATRENLRRARWGLAESEFRLAQQQYTRRDSVTALRDAKRLAESALTRQPDHRGARTLISRIDNRIKDLEERGEMRVPVIDREETIALQKSIAELMEEAKDLLRNRRYEQAGTTLNRILIQDPFNVDAMRLQRRLEEIRQQIAKIEREATTARAMRQVADTWSPPIDPTLVSPRAREGEGRVQDAEARGSEQLRTKMQGIMIPLIEFRQANIQDVVSFLVDASIAGDPTGEGVNIILNLSTPEDAGFPAAAPAAPAADDWGADFGGFGGGADAGFGGFDAPAAAPAPLGGPGGAIPTITLNLRRVSLLDAITYITEVAGLKFRIEERAVIVTPANVPTGRIVTEMYPVQPTIMDVIVEQSEDTQDQNRGGGDFIAMGTGTTIRQETDVKGFFAGMGVPFPAGTSIQYNRSISQLIVRNTPENLEIFERILNQLNVIPTQVEIEARFVEVLQSDLEELGFEWLLTDNWQIAERQTTGMPGGNERVQIDQDQDGLTKGLRFFGYDGTTGRVAPGSAVTMGANQVMGGLLSVSSVLTNPQLSVIIHALSQRGNSDLLSAPRVTARSGMNATIQVVNEIIYPTEFDAQVTTLAAGVGGTDRTIVSIVPGSFETRQVGVILNVTPTVSADGYSIVLDLVPEVAELVDWIQYGSSHEGTSYNIPQPIFSSRNVATSLVVYDGATVVMGGLIREDMVRYKDKVPLLGDIPLLGRFFRSEGTSSQKRNLLIFVTARLVDPEGKPLQKQQAAVEMTAPGGN